MSEPATSNIAITAEAFIRAIETAASGPLSGREHLDLLDEITDWLVRTHIAHDVMWNNYYAKAGERLTAQREPLSADFTAGGVTP